MKTPPHINNTLKKITQETKAVFEKLHKYMGKAIRALVERPDEEHVLRLHRNRVYYVRADLMRKATNVRGRVGRGEAGRGGERERHARPPPSLPDLP